MSKLPCKAWQLSPNVDCSAEDTSQGGSTIVVLVKPELSYTRYHIKTSIYFPCQNQQNESNVRKTIENRKFTYYKRSTNLQIY